MICERCHGLGMVVNPAARASPEPFIGLYFPPGLPVPLTVPCPACGGCGRAHCCEGERPQGG